MIERNCTAADFAAALYDEVMAVDMHFIQLRAAMRGSEEIDAAAFRSHAVLNYIALLKIQKKAYRCLEGGDALQKEDGWGALLQASFCQSLLKSSLFVETISAAADSSEHDREGQQ